MLSSLQFQNVPVHVVQGTLPQHDTDYPDVYAVRTRADFKADGVAEGDLLGNYELTGLLGTGSTSVVFMGRHRKLLFPVAVKVLDTSTLSHLPALRAQLVSEAIMLAQLNHPNIVRLWDLDDEGPIPYLVLEYVAGGTLADLIRDKGQIPIPYAFAIIRQIVEGLAEAHKLGIVHRDVKPGNFLLGRDGHVKVSDLGLAMVKSEQSRMAAREKKETRPAGTSAYMAPEQALSSEQADFRADIYSLGATFYHLITGRLPYEARSPMEMIMKHLREPIPDPRTYVPELPVEGAELIKRMMAKVPNDRHTTYDELRTSLAQTIGDRRAVRPLAEAFLKFAEARNK